MYFFVKVVCTSVPAAVAQLTPKAPFIDAPSSGLDLCYFESKVYFLVKVVCTSVPAAVAQLTPRAPFIDAPSSGLDLVFFSVNLDLYYFLKVYFLVSLFTCGRRRRPAA